VTIAIKGRTKSNTGYKAILMTNFGMDLPEAGYLWAAAVHSNPIMRNPTASQTLIQALGFIVAEWLGYWRARTED